MKKKISAVLGVDIFVSAKFGTEFPQRVGKFELKNVTSRGTPTNANSAQEIVDIGWLTVRYMFASQTANFEEANSEILSLLQKACTQMEWSGVQKLYEIDGEKAFS